jgi:hypothetical protein
VLVDVYRLVIERSLSDGFAKRRNDEVHSPSCCDLRAGVLSPPA